MYCDTSPLARMPPYHLTWYDSSYSNLTPYTEPLAFLGEPGDESSLENYWRAADDVFSRFWYTDELNGESYSSEIPSAGEGNWLGQFESHLAGRWGEDITPNGYDTSENGSQNISAVNEPFGSYYGYNDDIQSAYAGNELYSIGDDVYHYDWPETQSDVWDGRRICESIFGNWPCMLQLDQDSHG